MCYYVNMLQGADARILSYYRDRDVGNFTELCKHADYPTDLGAYYIARLMRAGYLHKLQRGTYEITVKGKQQVIDLLTQKHTLKHNRIRVIVLFVGTQAGKYICIRRQVQPFLGRIEWPAGEVNTGETRPDAARRLFTDRIGKEHPVRMHGFFRRMDMFKGGVFDDKLFAVHTYELPPDFILHEHSPRGELVRLTAEEIVSEENASRSLVDIFHYVQNDQHDFQEHVYELKKSDIESPSP